MGRPMRLRSVYLTLVRGNGILVRKSRSRSAWVHSVERMETFNIDSDRLLFYNADVVEQFWRGVTPGTDKWRIHMNQLGIEVTENKKCTAYDVRVGELRGTKVGRDILFSIPNHRLFEWEQFASTIRRDSDSE